MGHHIISESNDMSHMLSNRFILFAFIIPLNISFEDVKLIIFLYISPTFSEEITIFNALIYFPYSIFV